MAASRSRDLQSYQVTEVTPTPRTASMGAGCLPSEKPRTVTLRNRIMTRCRVMSRNALVSLGQYLP